MTERDIFIAALQKEDPAQRLAYLDAACALQPELRRQVEDLLRLHEGAGSFLAAPALAPAPTWVFHETAEYRPSPESAGTMVGPYRLLEPLGEGGMGTVWLAEQTAPVQRLVALKLIKAGMDSAQVVARFEAERQALALMDHPNIARVFDVGTTDAGRPFFVMELVRGVPITRYCDEQRLTPRRRLGLFVAVCHAVQHAHQKGVIHRDLKPSNILVALYDGEPVPKVIDFGVAKAAGEPLTDKTLFTGFGAIVGTLEYMSPEQAEINQLDVDTRSDVYSLGVLLYELLTGGPPFSRKELEKSGVLEMLRVIREQEPSKPSAKLSSSDALPTLSANRGTEPAKLTRLVRGELDWIVMKALEKDRNRRYETANGLAADVRRYLDNEPVQACPPTLAYRVRKFVHRHRGAVVATALIVLTLVGGIIGTTIAMFRAADEAGQKQDALADAEEQLFQARVHGARAELNSGRVGQRFEALKLIRQAARTRVTPELKTLAAAALVLPDVEVAHEWEAGGPFFGTAFDTDFVRYVRFDKEGEIVLCRRSEGREEVLARHRAPGDPVFIARISPDGNYLAYTQGLRSTPVRVCRLEASRIEERFVIPEAVRMWSLAFRADSRQLALGNADGFVSVHDLERGVPVRRWDVGTPPMHLAFHPNDGRLAVAAGNAVRLFDVDSGKELPALRHASPVRGMASIAWHPDGHRLVTACNDFRLHLWDTRTATEVMPPLVDGHEGLFVAFNPTGDLLLREGYGSQTRIWDVATGRQLLKSAWKVGHGFSRDGRLLGVGAEGNKVRVSRLADGRELRVLRRRNAGPLERLITAVLHPDGRTLAAGDPHRLTFFDLTSGEELGSLPLPHFEAARPVFFDPGRRPPPSQGVNGAAAEPSGGWVTAGHGSVLDWPARFDPEQPTVLRVGPARRLVADAGQGYSQGASTSEDGRVVAVPRGDSTLVLHRDEPERRLVLGPQYDVRFSAVSPDGRWVFTGSHWTDGKTACARIWDARTGKPVRELPLAGSTSARFSPDGRWLLTYSADSRLWEVDGWGEARRLQHYGGVFSPDSRLLATSAGMGMIRVEEAATGREVAQLTGPEPTWYTPDCFTPDGTRLVARDATSTSLYVFDLRLIREGLKELGLDWDWPEFPPVKADGGASRVSRVEILPGELGKPALSPEQRAQEAIARLRKQLEANSNDASACNNLAWMYLTAPEPLRDAAAALPLAEKAAQLKPGSPTAANTLGLAYLRARRYREAVAVLRPNLEKQVDSCLGHDLYLLALSHHELGEPARARDYYDWAIRWTRTHRGRSPDEVAELDEFRAEAEKLLGVKKDR